MVGFRPMYFVSRAGTIAPKNAPALRRATILEEMCAECAGLVESLNSEEKLFKKSVSFPRVAAVHNHLLNATTEPATPVS